MARKNKRSLNLMLAAVALVAAGVFAVCVHVVADSNGAALVKDGKAACVIVVSDSATEPELHAAKELQEFIYQISGAKLDVKKESEAGDGPAVLLGDTKRGLLIVPDVDVAKLGPEGFVVRTKDGSVAIRGGGPAGVLYGAYSILEESLESAGTLRTRCLFRRRNQWCSVR